MGLNAFYRYQIFALDSTVVEVQEMFSSHAGHAELTCRHNVSLLYEFIFLILLHKECKIGVKCGFNGRIRCVK